MIALLASMFRTLNARLLSTRGPVNTLLKISYLASVYAFRGWTRGRRSPQPVTITNYDRDLKIRVDISKTMGASLYWTGFHEFNEMRFLNRYLREDMVFVDIGANQGEYTLFAGKRLRHGRVLAFEPMSSFFEQLTENVRLNNLSNVRCFPLGLSDKAAKVPIYHNADNADNHEGLASLYPVGTAGDTEEISLTTLDDLVLVENIEKIDFIKLDVEGSEWPALKGAEHVLSKWHPALMVELNQLTAAKAGYAVEDMVDWLTVRGYKGYEIDRGRLVPLKISSFCNAVFVYT